MVGREMTSIRQRSGSGARRGALGVLAGALLPGFLAGAAAANSLVPSGADTNLSISGGTARLVGTKALIAVECEGPRDGLCSGRLSVSSRGQTRTAPYSVFAGSHQSLPVSLGHGFAGPGRAAVAVARTTQSAGGFARSRAIIRFS